MTKIRRWDHICPKFDAETIYDQNSTLRPYTPEIRRWDHICPKFDAETIYAPNSTLRPYMPQIRRWDHILILHGNTLASVMWNANTLALSEPTVGSLLIHLPWAARALTHLPYWTAGSYLNTGKCISIAKRIGKTRKYWNPTWRKLKSPLEITFKWDPYIHF